MTFAPDETLYTRTRHEPGAAFRNDILTEDSAALAFTEQHADDLRYCHDTGSWFRWSGANWEREKKGLAFTWARELARSLADSEPDKTRFVTSKTSFAAGVERFCRHDPAFAVTADEWDKDPFLLGTPGGTVDLRTGRLRPARPNDMITRTTAVVPADRAECPLWLSFLMDATAGDLELIQFLQQWCGYGLTGDTREHALVFVHGGGGNGKSVFLNTVTAIAGGYASTAAMDTFTASKFERHSTEVAMLRGARMVTASETEEGRSWAEARIKQMTGGDPITARFMRQDNFTFKPEFKLTIIGNHRPMLRNVDEAARRRFNIVPFTRKPASPDRELEQKLRAEWRAILRWMINGCVDWQAQGLIRPEIVKQATEGYFSEQDLFGQWIEDECRLLDPNSPGAWATSAELFESWKKYANAAGEEAGSMKSLGSALLKRGFPSYRNGQARGYRGISLKRPAVQPRHEGDDA